MAKSTYIKGLRYYSSNLLSDYIFISEDVNSVDIIIVRQFQLNEFCFYPWHEQIEWSHYTQLELIKREEFEKILKSAEHYLKYFESKHTLKEDENLLKRHRLYNDFIYPINIDESCND